MTAPRLGSVIIPAHNEAAVIGRTLAPLAALVAAGELEVIVACNGCTDDTAAIAAAVPGVRVLDVNGSSKVAALNAGDAAATGWPRLYLDADIEIDPAAVTAVLTRLAEESGPAAARPAARYELSDVDPLASAYYRVRSRIPALSQHLWGAGAYAISRRGHERFAAFPALTADDFWIDRQFTAAEKEVVACPPVAVRPPRSSRVLLHTLTRVYNGNTSAAEAVDGGSTTIGLREVLGTARGPRSAVDALVYVGFAVAGRIVTRWRAARAGRSGALRWARDDSSRTPAAGPAATAAPAVAHRSDTSMGVVA